MTKLSFDCHYDLDDRGLYGCGEPQAEDLTNVGSVCLPGQRQQGWIAAQERLVQKPPQRPVSAAQHDQRQLY